MFNRPSGVRTYGDERQRLLEAAAHLDPHLPEYKTVMDRIDQLDKISKRSGDKAKAFIPACATVVSVIGIYALQQFAGVVIPKALDVLTGRSTSDRNEKD